MVESRGSVSSETKTEYEGVIKTEIKVQARAMRRNAEDHQFILTFDENSFEMIDKILATGAPVWFGIQKVRQ